MGDISIVADILRDAVDRRSRDLERLRVVLRRLTRCHGFTREDGAVPLDHLLVIAGIDGS